MSNVVTKIRDSWEKAQKAHDKDYVWGWQWGHDKILEQVSQLTGGHIKGRVLEIGCGGGKWTRWLFRFTEEVYSVDVHNTALAQAALYESRAHYSRCNGESLGWSAGFFDTVFTWDVLLHLPDLLVQQYFNEAYRVLKHGGRFVFALPDLMTERSRTMYRNAVGARRWRSPYNLGYMTYYTEQRIRAMLEVAGFGRGIHLGHAGNPEPREIVFLARRSEDG